MNLVKLHRINHWCFKKKIGAMCTVVSSIQFLVYNSIVPASVKIGQRSKFGYRGIGVVIHSRAIIGKDCTIGQGITIGGRSKKKNVPIIGDNVYIGAGCRILGDIRIGDNVILGPNSVVISSIPSNSIAVGVPAKIIKQNINPDDYI